jgi:hypothetical protein
MRRLAVAFALLSLGVGPWLALPSGASASPWSSLATAGWGRSLLPEGILHDDPITSVAAPTGCTCHEVTVDATNVVRDADVTTGDAKVVNRSITYVAPTYGDDDVDVDQEAIAHSGDAVAGQILAVDGGTGCSRVRVHATNIVENADVRSGDAVARNESVVLVDPRLLQRGDLDIDVDQEADAKSGDAIAGQVIGVKGGGGPCGSVILEALNRVKHVDVESGDAEMENLSKVLACADKGCLDEVRLLLKEVDAVDVCDASGCHSVPSKEFVGMLKDSFDDNVDADVFSAPDTEAEAAPGDDPAKADDAADEHASPEPTLGPPFVRRERRTHRTDAVPAAEPSPEPTPAPATSSYS